MVTDRSMRLASGPVGRGAAPAVARTPYTNAATTAIPDTAYMTNPSTPARLWLPRSSQNVANASWMKPPIRRTRRDHAALAFDAASFGVSARVMSRSFCCGTR